LVRENTARSEIARTAVEASLAMDPDLIGSSFGEHYFPDRMGDQDRDSEKARRSPYSCSKRKLSGLGSARRKYGKFDNLRHKCQMERSNLEKNLR
jgi:hypothetical protein